MTQQQIKTLVSFGNYLLSNQREGTIKNKTILDQVNDVDIDNWIHSLEVIDAQEIKPNK